MKRHLEMFGLKQYVYKILNTMYNIYILLII